MAWEYPPGPVTANPLLEELEAHGLAGERRGTREPERVDESHPYIRVDMSRCIDCFRCQRICDDLQGQFVWRAWNRGDRTEIRPVREVDTVARFGGDEFVVMLSELGADKAVSVTQAGVVAEKIRQVLGEPYRLSVMREGDLEPRIVKHRCTASIGVALFNDHGVTQEDLIKLADAAMYQAKSAGRNRVYFADS